MKKTEKFAGRDIIGGSVELEKEGDELGSDHERYCEIYRELADIIGETAVIKLWKRYGGLSVTFPQRLYSREYIREYIRQKMETEKVSQIARNVDLSERRVRQIIRELKEE